MKYPIIIEQSGPMTFCVHSPDVNGCAATGESVEDAVSGFRDVLEYHLRAIREAGGEVPQPKTLVATVEVSGVA